MSEANGPGTALPPESVDDFLEILEDTEEWELDPASWAVVDAIVARARAAAARAGDARDLQEATVDLELRSPIRGNDAGKGKQSDQQRQTKVNLQHELKPPQRTGGGSRVVTPERVADQELVVHYYLPLDGPRAAGSYAELRHTWRRCQDVLGMSAPLRHGPAPARDLPPTLAELPQEAGGLDVIVAAQKIPRCSTRRSCAVPRGAQPLGDPLPGCRRRSPARGARLAGTGRDAGHDGGLAAGPADRRGRGSDWLDLSRFKGLAAYTRRF